MLPDSLRTGERVRQTIEAYGAMIYRLAYARTLSRSDAEDVFQEVMLRFIQYGEPFESAEHEKAWLIRITCNLSVHVVKSAWRRYAVGMEQAAAAKAPEEPSANEDLLQAMARLAPKYRTPIHLFYFEDMPVEEIAQILARRPSTVRSQLTRGREKLKKCLMEGGRDEWT